MEITTIIRHKLKYNNEREISNALFHIYALICFSLVISYTILYITI